MTSAYVAHQDIAIFVTGKVTKDKIWGFSIVLFQIMGMGKNT